MYAYTVYKVMVNPARRRDYEKRIKELINEKNINVRELIKRILKANILGTTEFKLSFFTSVICLNNLNV